MTDENSLTVIDQKEVIFYGDEITAVRADDGHIYVSVRHLCDALGLDRRGQIRRIERQEILYEGYFMGDIATNKGNRSTNLLRVDLIPLWLSGVRISAVREDLRDQLSRYQREAAKTLWEAFQDGRLSTNIIFDDLLTQNTPAVHAYKMAQAIMQMARQQIMLEARLDQHEDRLGMAEGRVNEVEGRLETIEATLGDKTRQISTAQASHVSQAVKAVALALGERSGRNEFGGVYGELYRRFEIAGYRELPAARYDEAMAFLRQWYTSLTGEGEVPF